MCPQSYDRWLECKFGNTAEVEDKIVSGYQIAYYYYYDYTYRKNESSQYYTPYYYTYYAYNKSPFDF